jgi:hypothetical protein
MFLPEKSYEPNDVGLLNGFLAAWLCVDPNDDCYDGDYDYNDDDVVDLADWAELVDRPWDLPTPYETRFYYLRDALGSVMGLIGARLGNEDDREFYLYDVCV